MDQKRHDQMIPQQEQPGEYTVLLPPEHTGPLVQASRTAAAASSTLRWEQGTRGLG